MGRPANPLKKLASKKKPTLVSVKKVDPASFKRELESLRRTTGDFEEHAELSLGFYVVAKAALRCLDGIAARVEAMGAGTIRPTPGVLREEELERRRLEDVKRADQFYENRSFAERRGVAVADLIPKNADPAQVMDAVAKIQAQLNLLVESLKKSSK